MPTRRRLLRTLAGAGAAALGAPFVNRGRYRLFADAERRYSARALEVVQRTTAANWPNGSSKPVARNRRGSPLGSGNTQRSHPVLGSRLW
jgi:hypothetical protein